MQQEQKGFQTSLRLYTKKSYKEVASREFEVGTKRIRTAPHEQKNNKGRPRLEAGVKIYRRKLGRRSLFKEIQQGDIQLLAPFIYIRMVSFVVSYQFLQLTCVGMWLQHQVKNNTDLLVYMQQEVFEQAKSPSLHTDIFPQKNVQQHTTLPFQLN